MKKDLIVPENKIVESNKYLLTPEELIAKGIESNIPVETMKELLAMRKELKAEYAKEEFDKAMAKFQAKCPIIKKNTAGAKTEKGMTVYKYATLDDIVKQTKELISECGFSYAIKIEKAEVGLKAICIVKHAAGHSEQSEMEVPLTTKTNVMSQPQVYAATSTFAKRYAFVNAFGIMTGDEDNDIVEKQKKITKMPMVKDVMEKIKTLKTQEKLDESKEWVDKANYTDMQKNILYRAIEEQEKLCI